MALKTREELYQIYIDEVKANNPNLTDFEEGSISDVLAGASTLAVYEAIGLIADDIKKTFLSSAEGTDLEFLAVDHFGPDFARPLAKKATGIVQFSRANTGAGDCIIPAGTVVKTTVDANGQTQRFATILAVTMTGLTINASIEAVVAGAKGNVLPDAITVVESSLTDSSITVNNDEVTSGGAEIEDDSEYRQTIAFLIQQIKGATAGALESKAKTVTGVVSAHAIEEEKAVKFWDIIGNATLGSYFLIPYVTLYIADANGTASETLVDQVQIEINKTRAFGVKVQIVGAIALSIDWDAAISLNPSGPNYAALVLDPQMIIDTMQLYIQSLTIGDDFDRVAAKAYIMAKWGPAGTDDLTDFIINTPSGNITTAANEKLIAGTVSIS